MSSIIWNRIDSPGHEFASLKEFDEGWLLKGSSVFLDKRTPVNLNYVLRCNLDWHTVSADVNGFVGDEKVDIQIAVSEDQEWEMNGKPCTAVEGCFDIDFGFSPVTNLLPIRRLELDVGQEEDVRAAWLPFPNLTLEHLPQKYRRESDKVYRYQSAGGRFVRRIEVNDEGFVIDYPGFWEVE